MVGTNGMRIDIGSSLTLDPMDTVLIASDGVYDNLHLDEIIACIRRGTPAGAAARLVEGCLSRMTQPPAGLPSKPDDLTFILFRLDS
jgi:serine/threonine protein phosphatase PrpC